MNAAESRGEAIDDLVDLPFLDDQRRRERYDVASLPDENAVLEAVHQNVVCPLARFVRPRLQLDPGNEPEIADIDDMRAAAQRVDRLLPEG